MVKIGRFLLVLLVVIVAQTCIVHRFVTPAFRPDLFFLLSFFLGLKVRERDIVLSVILVGLVGDVFSVGRFGVGAFYALTAGAGAYVARRHYFSDLALVRAVAVFALLWLADAVHGIVLRFAWPNLALGTWLRVSACQALMTGLLAPTACRLLAAIRLVRPWREF